LIFPRFGYRCFSPRFPLYLEESQTGLHFADLLYSFCPVMPDRCPPVLPRSATPPQIPRTFYSYASFYSSFILRFYFSRLLTTLSGTWPIPGPCHPIGPGQTMVFKHPCDFYVARKLLSRLFSLSFRLKSFSAISFLFNRFICVPLHHCLIGIPFSTLPILHASFSFFCVPHSPFATTSPTSCVPSHKSRAMRCPLS